MACVLMVGWVRSEYVHDGIFCYLPAQMNEIGVISYRSKIYFWKQTFVYQLPKGGPLVWNSHRLPHRGLMLAATDLQWTWRLCGFGVCYDKLATEVGDRMISFAIPYWACTVPLTLLSAYLLLSKPRAAKPPVAQPDRPATV